MIYPCFWMDNNAREVADFYCSLFPDSSLQEESAFAVSFRLAGQRFMCLNGGEVFRPNPSISFYVVCESKEEVDYLWKGLSEGAEVMMALGAYPWSARYGWLSDRYGVSWQLALGKLEEVGQKITPTLMFTQKQAGKAREAINRYTNIFPDSSVVGILPYAAGDGDVEGYIKHAQFRLSNHVFMAMDSSLAHAFTFSEGVSLVVECDTQSEIDMLWQKLTDGGEESQCGWLKDAYQVSWQIIPKVLATLMSDPERAPRVAQAFMKMKKFDIEALMKA
ncbi:VOC family protein [Cytophagales bacterium LB-30]|uniref:VOC family protein n=1 Tax=Shiella aurantiaca TaxID=3058365 RepID=A0ABT8F3L3_9BACT|nr:VOC family protein [Shiella aurantiaca]MDN4165057.1 VOC family protein [Shiella aurantiaca]